MSTLIISPVDSPLAIRWKREDCDNLEKAGILNYRYELVEGVINRLPQNINHANIIRRLIAWLFSAFGEDYVLTQMTIDVRPEDNPTNEPQPDGIVLSRPAEEFNTNPKPADILLCIEASDTTLAYDLTTKASLYARAGIVEYWVINFPERKLHIHRNSQAGVYQNVTIHVETDTVTSLISPDICVQVSKLLPRQHTSK